MESTLPKLKVVAGRTENGMPFVQIGQRLVQKNKNGWYVCYIAGIVKDSFSDPEQAVDHLGLGQEAKARLKDVIKKNS